VNGAAPRYSTAEVAARAGVHRDTLLRWLREGRVPEPRRDRNRWRSFTSDELTHIAEFARVKGHRDGHTQVSDPGAAVDPIERLERINWDFADAKTNDLTHGLHPYPAKFIPQIPNALIRELSSVGETVGDIFCGSGTTLVEALTLKRNAVGIDANPLACLISEAKTVMLTPTDAAELGRIALQSTTLGEQLATSDHQGNLSALAKRAVPEHDAVEFWFDDFITEELAQVRLWIASLTSRSARTLARAVFASIIVAVSRQDSDTRYVRRDKHLKRGDALRRFGKGLADAVRAAQEFASIVEPRFTRHVHHANVLDAPKVGKLELVVCSPPYPNAYSYHLYHMTRMLWLDMDQPQFKRVEIGSHRKYSAKGAKAATNDTFASEMAIIFKWLRDALRKDRYCCFVVGDSIIAGQLFNNADTIAAAGRRHGFAEIARIERTLQDTKKAFNPKIGRIKQEHVLILQNRATT
jgi:site-specific DNA-methyltransferase (cytosine-N4-specific)